MLGALAIAHGRYGSLPLATVLAWASYLAVRTWAWIPPSQDHDASIVAAWPYWLTLCYLPALARWLGDRHERETEQE